MEEIIKQRSAPLQNAVLFIKAMMNRKARNGE